MTTVDQANARTVRRLYENYLNENHAELLPSEERGIAAYAAHRVERHVLAHQR